MLQGYDISSHQKGIQPGRLPGDFVIIKITQDTRVVNISWQTWAEEVLKAGKLLGLYHYAGGKDALPCSLTGKNATIGITGRCGTGAASSLLICVICLVRCLDCILARHC